MVSEVFIFMTSLRFASWNAEGSMSRERADADERAELKLPGFPMRCNIICVAAEN